MCALPSTFMALVGVPGVSGSDTLNCPSNFPSMFWRGSPASSSSPSGDFSIKPSTRPRLVSDANTTSPIDGAGFNTLVAVKRPAFSGS